MQGLAPSLLLLAFLVILVHGHNVGFAPEDLSSEQSIRGLFAQWCIKHAKSYSSDSEKEFRYGIFKNSLEAAHAHNSQLPPPSYAMGLNAFSDITNEEFHAGSDRSGLMPKIPRNKISFLKRFGAGSAPASIDWRSKGAVTSVKDVLNCTGGSWAFAVAGAVESINQITTGQLVDLSAQQILDCSSEYGTWSCTAGVPQYGLWYLNESLGIYREAAYPFTAQNAASCQRTDGSIVSIDNVDNLWSQSDESEIIEVVAQQPVTALIDGNTPAFQSYTGGIFTGPCSEDTNLTTGVLIVGYGTEKGQDYWIIKNSRGSSWGESGYMRLQRGVARCGINAFIYYPTKKAHPAKTISQGLVGWWKLQEKSGSVAADSSSSQATGIISGATWDTSAGGLQFNGGGKVSFGSKASLCGKTSFSLSARVKVSSSTTSKGVIVQQRGPSNWTGTSTTDGYNGEYQLYLEGGKPWLWVYGNYDHQWRFSGTTEVNDGKWHHIVAVRDGREGRLYVDGVLSGSASGDVKDLVSNLPVYLGGDYRDNVDKLVGSLAAVRIYNRVLTVEEIKLLSTLQV